MKYSRLVLLALAAIVAIGCGVQERKGVITFALNSRVAIGYSIMPGTSLELDHYVVHGIGNSGQATGSTFDVDIGPSGTGEVEVLPGNWTLQIQVMNDDTPSVAVGAGSTTLDVIVGTPANASCTIYPFTGLGNFEASISWVPDVITHPVIEVDLVDHDNVTTSVTMTNTSSTSAHGTAQLEAGWKIGFLRVTDAGVMSAGIVRSVRVAANALTHWSEHLTVAQLEGILIFDFEWLPGMPLTVTTDRPYEIQVYDGLNVTVTASCVDNDPATSVVYAWYVNGLLAAVSSTASYEIVASAYQVESQNYLSVIAWQSDGKRAGDAQHKIVRVAMDPEMVSIDGQVNSASFSYGVPVDVTIYLTPDWVNPVAVQEIVNGGFFSFDGLAAGTYALRASFGGTDNSWWNAGGVKQNGAAPSEVIVIPQLVPQDFNFTWLLGG